jgi:hypothetical protein
MKITKRQLRNLIREFSDDYDPTAKRGRWSEQKWGRRQRDETGFNTAKEYFDWFHSDPELKGEEINWNNLEVPPFEYWKDLENPGWREAEAAAEAALNLVPLDLKGLMTAADLLALLPADDDASIWIKQGSEFLALRHPNFVKFPKDDTIQDASTGDRVRPKNFWVINTWS